MLAQLAFAQASDPADEPLNRAYEQLRAHAYDARVQSLRLVAGVTEVLSGPGRVAGSLSLGLIVGTSAGVLILRSRSAEVAAEVAAER